MLQLHATSINKLRDIAQSGTHTKYEYTGRPMARARDAGTGARNHGTNRIQIYGQRYSKVHANVLIIVVPFGSNFTG